MKRRKTRLPSNWRDRIEIIVDKHCTGETEFKLVFKPGRTPKGFFRRIGYLDVTDVNVVVAVKIDPYFRHRGLGMLLYVYALNHFGSLTTYYHHASDEAQRLWRSLVCEYQPEYDFFGGRLTVFANKKEIESPSFKMASN